MRATYSRITALCAASATLGHQHGWNRLRVELGKSSADRGAGFLLVVSGNFGSGQPLRDRNWPVEIVRMRCAETRDRLLRLRPGGGKFGMCMRHAPDTREVLVQYQMRG